MLGMKKYPKKYIDDCRERVKANLRAYREQAKKAPFRNFEARYFNDQVLLLDYMFVHRLTGIEGKEGNPLNEVRIICNSILLNHGKLQVEKLPGWPNSAGSAMRLPQEIAPPLRPVVCASRTVPAGDDFLIGKTRATPVNFFFAIDQPTRINLGVVCELR